MLKNILLFGYYISKVNSFKKLNQRRYLNKKNFCICLSILYLFSNYWLNPLYVFFSFVYYLAYSANFYLIFSVNSLFRQEFYSLFIGSKIRQQQQQQQNVIRTYRQSNNNITYGAREEYSLEYRRNKNTLNR